MICPSAGANKIHCEHELAVLRKEKDYIRQLEPQVLLDEIIETTPENDNENHSTVPLSERVIHDGNWVVSDVERNGRNDAEFVSCLPRPFFSCKSDEERILAVMKTIIDRKESESHFVGVDHNSDCIECGYAISVVSSNKTFIRNCVLQTMNHGSVIIKVTEL